MKKAAALFVVASMVLGAAHEARAAATLMNGLGGPRGYGTSCIPPNDDGSWPNDTTGLDLTPAFPKGLHFYSGSYTRAWINNNGNLSFNSALSTYTPDAFPGALQPMIAPYWADVDTRDSTTCDAMGYPSAGGYPMGATCTNPASNGVWWSLTTGQMVVTWDQVGFYHCHTTPVMSFQMILTATGCGQTLAPDGGVSGVDFDIEFRYAQCGWEAGDASNGVNGFCPAGTVMVDGGAGGCVPAQAGFDSAETPDTDYASLPDSRMSGISTELCTQSNLTPPQPGVWRFTVHGGVIQCPTAGQPCMTGKPGICAAGVIQCSVSGATTCVPVNTPQPSQCNGLDNNCDGVIDTGPCPTNFTCAGAECVPDCAEGTCPSNWTCQNNGVCIENDCIGITCPVGQRCTMGKCVDACSGVVCPLGQVCRLGTCVDPCAGLNCGMGEVCENGVCVPTCPCKACTATQTCEMDGKCVDTACATKTCPTGFTCQAGTCVDDCKGAVCPVNQICQGGMCVPHIVPVDAGMGILVPPDGSAPPPSDAGSSGDATTHDGGGSLDGGPVFGEGGSKSGCGCRAVGSGLQYADAMGVGIGVLALFGRRRRRR